MPVYFDTHKIAAVIKREMDYSIVQATERVREEAVRLVLETEKTGRLYGKHRASSPGQPWASNTGFTVGQIKTHYDHDKLIGTVTIDAEWGPYLEMGTNKMAARPVLRPALANTAPERQRLLQQAVERALKDLSRTS